MRARALLVLAALAPLLAVPVRAQDIARRFDASCGACHGAAGIGQPGVAPPLVNPALYAALGDNAVPYLTGVMVGGLTGAITVDGVRYAGLAMPPQSWMADEDLAAFGAYVLETLNGLEIAIDPALIAARRAAPLGHAALRAMREEAAP